MQDALLSAPWTSGLTYHDPKGSGRGSRSRQDVVIIDDDENQGGNFRAFSSMVHENEPSTSRESRSQSLTYGLVAKSSTAGTSSTSTPHSRPER